MLYDQIELDYRVEEEARTDISELITQGNAEMNSFQHAFIAGLISSYKPNKMVEIGVAAGGTTCFLHECAKRNNYHPTIYSVDKFETYYRIPTKRTGYLINEMALRADYEGIVDYQNTIIGQSIPFVINRIGKDIDFLLLDTTHRLPGELLDFLVCLPYLKLGAVVVLHDTICNVLNNNESFATKLLFDVVKAKKLVIFNENEEWHTHLPNIMAFVITEDTIKCPIDILSALTMNWQYELDSIESEKYAEIIENHYGKEYGTFFKGIDAANRKNLLLKQITEYFGDKTLIQRWKKTESPVIIYGNGFWGSKFIELSKLENFEIAAVIVSDDREIDKEIKRDVPIYRLSDVPKNLCIHKIIYAVDNKYRDQIESDLLRSGFELL